ncbi:NAD(P)-dependent oxidoreductase [Desulfovibrio sp. OttesenSCG-928-O18]|nr:NAD(P)-dependent oxidoreductase [Desulfovibrio sp. OttesenSCG-928-O18]
MARIAFIGLGAMGLPMAKRLCAAGHELRVAVHKNRTPAEEIAALGGSIAANFTELVAGVEVIISIVPDDAQLSALFLTPEILEAVAPGTLLIEMTTATPAMMRNIAAFLEPKGVDVLDAPVSGGIKGAAEGTLTIMCGGKRKSYERAMPLLEAMGQKIPLVGGVGAGKALKAVNQLLVSVNTVVVAEALALARKLDVDLEAMREVVATSSGYSTAFGNKFESMTKGDYIPRFTTALMRKDIGIALAEGADIALPLTVLANHLYEMLGPDADDLDYSVIAELYKPR